MSLLACVVALDTQNDALLQWIFCKDFVGLAQLGEKAKMR
jgi:hypothetical protein